MKVSHLILGSAVAALWLSAGVAADPSAERASPGWDGGIMSADTNHDGKISRDEALAAAAKRTNAWFDKLDANKDGFVTQDEMNQARSARHDAMKTQMEDRFKMADVNGDGKLSLDEVKAKLPRLAPRFNELDTDHDGFLSPEELKHAFGGMQRHHGPPPAAPAQ